jgi:hypothetical protein
MASALPRLTPVQTPHSEGGIRHYANPAPKGGLSLPGSGLRSICPSRRIQALVPRQSSAPRHPAPQAIPNPKAGCVA